MMHDLSDLYNGRVGPTHAISPDNTRYHSLQQQCGALREKLEKRLAAEDLKLLYEVNDLQILITALELEINYIEGLRDGAGIMLDVATGKRGTPA